MCLLGIGMIVGGFMAWLIAISSVLLPYDESRSDRVRPQSAMDNIDTFPPHFERAGMLGF